MTDKISLYSVLGIAGETFKQNIALVVVAFCVSMFYLGKAAVVRIRSNGGQCAHTSAVTAQPYLSYNTSLPCSQAPYRAA